MDNIKNRKDYQCWLGYDKVKDPELLDHYQEYIRDIAFLGDSPIINSAREELNRGLAGLLGYSPDIVKERGNDVSVIIGKLADIPGIETYYDGELLSDIEDDGFRIMFRDNDMEKLIITSRTDSGILYGVFSFLRMLQMERRLADIDILSNPVNPLRMINHWDHLDGSVGRGYAGNSILFEGNELTDNLVRVKDYARLLASTGINCIAINNVNVHYEGIRMIDDKRWMIKKLAEIFRNYGIKTFVSVNFASPIGLKELDTADPLNEDVRNWWSHKVEELYNDIPDFGGFLVKADSEGWPGPFAYDRSHAQGANMLAEALEPFGGLLIWRCFVYDCQQDWRDYSTDRARAAYDNFKPLDGKFKDNVILQIKNGPMDFQVREPVSPLFGALEKTNQILELQITQEYTGQQRHLCYLIPQWKEVLEFDTYARGENSPVKRIIDGSLIDQEYNGFAAIVNVGDDLNWTGHTLAQANLYGYGRLAWNPDLTAEEITEEWVRCTFGNDQQVVDNISAMMLASWEIYENYNAPLGVGWMVNPSHHYGPNVDGYEYSRWGTYHRADFHGIGVDRTMETGTGYTGQYFKENMEKYESLLDCPDELLLFFHHVPYTYRLKSGKTVIQHIYDTHFKGANQARELRDKWIELKDKIDKIRYDQVLKRLNEQVEHAKEWRDVINTYFYRKTGIPDKNGRKIY